ncbi:MAG: hypothetical protein P1U74_00560 [Legionellaceae bacterium]|nr:hypothetical protein [Legionellaceae bacterium]
MPCPNPYFHLLQALDSNIDTNDSEVVLSIDRMSLPKIKTSLAKFEISELQIVIPAIIEDLSESSNYLFRASLSNPSMQPYTLEVQLNMKEKSLSRVTVTNQVTKEALALSQLETDIFINYAFVCGIPTMKKLYQEVNPYLEHNRSIFEEQITSFFEQEDPNSLSSLDELISRSEIIENLSGPHRLAILKKYRLVIEKNIATQKELESELDGDYDLLDDNDIYEFPISNGTIATERKEQEKQDEIKQSNRRFKALIKELEDKTLHLKQHARDAGTKTVIKYYKQTMQALEMAEQPDIAISITDINTIHTANRKGLILGKNLLIKALSPATDFVGIDEELSIFIPEINDMLLSSFLHKNKTDPFCWLLTHASYPIDLIETDLAGQPNPVSLLEAACALQNTDAFRLLIQLNASPLFITKDARVFAHDIMQAYPNFSKILEDYQIRSKQESFFQNLIVLIEIWSLNVKLNSMEATRLTDIISNYEYNKTSEDITHNSSELVSIDKINPEIIILTGLGNYDIRRLRPLPEFQNAFVNYNLAYDSYKDAISNLSAAAITTKENEYLYTLLGKLQQKPLKLSGMPPNQIIQQLNTDAKLLNLACDIISLQDRYTQESTKYRNSNRKKTTNLSKKTKNELRTKTTDFEEQIEVRFTSNTTFMRTALQFLSFMTTGSPDTDLLCETQMSTSFVAPKLHVTNLKSTKENVDVDGLETKMSS